MRRCLCSVVRYSGRMRSVWAISLLLVLPFSSQTAAAAVQAGLTVPTIVEIVAGDEDLIASPATDPELVAFAQTRGRQLGAGTNLCLNGHALKLQLETSALFGDDGVDKQIARLQLDASF